MQVRLVRDFEGQFIVLNLNKNGDADIVSIMAIYGYEHTHNLDNPRVRAELQGQPVFSGLIGPMWDGDAIRYETQEVYNRLSN